MTLLLTKYKKDLIGIALGAIAGYLYWKFIGCSSGTCMITSKPINSTLYGAVMGYLIAGMIKFEKPD
jgi:phage shock protein E